MDQRPNIKSNLFSFLSRAIKVLLIKTKKHTNHKAKFLRKLFTSKLRISAKNGCLWREKRKKNIFAIANTK